MHHKHVNTECWEVLSDIRVGKKFLGAAEDQFRRGKGWENSAFGYHGVRGEKKDVQERASGKRKKRDR